VAKSPGLGSLFYSGSSSDDDSSDVDLGSGEESIEKDRRLSVHEPEQVGKDNAEHEIGSMASLSADVKKREKFARNWRGRSTAVHPEREVKVAKDTQWYVRFVTTLRKTLPGSSPR
jgi:hypothetical protein